MAPIAAASEPLETSAAARRLGVSPPTLFAWRAQGRGPVFSRRGRKIVYSVADLEATSKQRARCRPTGCQEHQGGSWGARPMTARALVSLDDAEGPDVAALFTTRNGVRARWRTGSSIVCLSTTLTRSNGSSRPFAGNTRKR
jgi:transposase-like protein